MQKKVFLDLHHKFTELMRETTKKKNSDYTGAGDDAFANFRKIGDLVAVPGVDLNQVGILTRMSDKMSRLGSFLAKGSFQVADESFVDTCVDLANYSLILAAYHLEAEDKPASCKRRNKRRS